MSLDDKVLDTWNEGDLQTLIDNQVPEGKRYDYKQQLPSGTDDDKKEFLYDVSSFANTSGGHLIFGVIEDHLIPTAMPGLFGIDIDAVKSRLESIIRDGIEPRIASIDIHAVSLTSGNVVVIMRIPQSWSGPHMVKFKGVSKFYARNSAGKYPLDVSEIRAAFTLSETAVGNIREFRVDRLAKVIANDTPIPIAYSSKIVVHVIPLRAFGAAVRYSLDSLPQQDTTPYWDLMHTGSCTFTRHNFDGYLAHGTHEATGKVDTYIQVFRNGIIEYVNSWLLLSERLDNPFIPSTAFEQNLLEFLPRALKLQKLLGVETPIFVMLSLLGVRGYRIAAPLRVTRRTNNMGTVDRDNLLLPETVIDTFDIDPQAALKPSFDIVWNSCGWREALSYDASGKWNPD
jgi:hypothetical protein